MSSDTPTLTDDVATVNRDETGDIVPENISIDYGGDTYTTTVRPLVAGHAIKYEQQHDADMDNFDTTAIDLIWSNHVVGLEADWKDVRVPIFMQVIEGITGQSDVSDEVKDAISDREQSLEEGN